MVPGDHKARQAVSPVRARRGERRPRGSKLHAAGERITTSRHTGRPYFVRLPSGQAMGSRVCLQRRLTEIGARR